MHARRRPSQRRSRAVRRRRGAALAVALAALLGTALVLGLGSGPGAARRAHTTTHLGIATTAPPLRARAGFAPGADEASPQMRRLIALGRPVYCAGRGGDEVALTFDDGPGPYTRLVLAKLHKHAIHATFFVVARNLRVVAGATRAERALGAVGDHTFTHPLLTALAPARAQAEIVGAQEAIARSSGGPVVLFRPPYGGRDRSIDAIARAHGLLEVLWNVDSADSLGASYAQIERNVIAGLHPGAIILLHENHGQTVRALLGIFAAIRARHLRPVSVPQLLTDDPPSAAQLRGGGTGCGLAGGRVSGD